jgi:hypothetical protein
MKPVTAVLSFFATRSASSRTLKSSLTNFSVRSQFFLAVATANHLLGWALVWAISTNGIGLEFYREDLGVFNGESLLR